jgi:hypothetical protein
MVGLWKAVEKRRWLTVGCSMTVSELDCARLVFRRVEKSESDIPVAARLRN